MHRFVSTAVLIIFFIWILPLGIFIKPINENKVCNGQRAICMCTHLLIKKITKIAKLTGISVWKNGDGVDYQNSLSGSTPKFLSIPFWFKTGNHVLYRIKLSHSFNEQVFVRPIDHVPLV